MNLVLEYDDKRLTFIRKTARGMGNLFALEEYPGLLLAPVVDEGRNAGTIGVGGLVPFGPESLKNSLEKQRNRHFDTVAQKSNGRC